MYPESGREGIKQALKEKAESTAVLKFLTIYRKERAAAISSSNVKCDGTYYSEQLMGLGYY